MKIPISAEQFRTSVLWLGFGYFEDIELADYYCNGWVENGEKKWGCVRVGWGGGAGGKR